MKITKRQLRQIIKEEKAKLAEMDPGSAGIAAAGGGSPADRGMAAARDDDRLRAMGVDPDSGLFHVDYLYDLFYDDFALIQPTAPTVPEEAFALFEEKLALAVKRLKKDLVV